jgi:hypothetical protein
LISQEYKTCIFLLQLQPYYLIDIIEEVTVTVLCVCVFACMCMWEWGGGGACSPRI